MNLDRFCDKLGQKVLYIRSYMIFSHNLDSSVRTDTGRKFVLFVSSDFLWAGVILEYFHSVGQVLSVIK